MSDAKEGRIITLDECPTARGMLVQVPATNLRCTVEAHDAARARADMLDRLLSESLTAQKTDRVERDEWKARAEKAEAHLTSAENNVKVLELSVGQLERRAEAAEAALAAQVRSDAAEREVAISALTKAWDEDRAALAKVTEERDDALDKLTMPAGTGYDPHAGTCAYCHGVGACPRCWGRVGIDQAHAERDAALRACAEMRAALVVARDSTVATAHTRETARRALSSDAGRGHLSPAEAKALVERVREACANRVKHMNSKTLVFARDGKSEDEAGSAIRTLDLSAPLEKP